MIDFLADYKFLEGGLSNSNGVRGGYANGADLLRHRSSVLRRLPYQLPVTERTQNQCEHLNFFMANPSKSETVSYESSRFELPICSQNQVDISR